MRIYDIVINEGINWPVWVEEALAKVGIKTASYAERKAAEAIAREMIRIEPFIEKVSVDYAEKVLAMRSKGFKDYDLEAFLKQNDPKWDVRTLKEKEAIREAVKTRTEAKIQAKTNPQAAAPTGTKPAEPAAKPKEKAKAKEEEPVADTDDYTPGAKVPSRKRIGKVRAKAGFEKAAGSMVRLFQILGIAPIAYSSWEDKVYYEERAALPKEDPDYITPEELGAYKRQVGEQFIVKTFEYIAFNKLAAKLGAGAGDMVGLLARLFSFGIFSGRTAYITGVLSSEVAAPILANWIEKSEWHQKAISWMVWHYIDPGFVAAGRWVGLEDEVGKLFKEIDDAKQKAGNTPQQPDTGATQPAAQSGKEVAQPSTVPSPGAELKPNVVKPNVGADAEADDAWQRLLNYK